MRLMIDANELKKKKKHSYKEFFENVVSVADIDNAPTIEVVLCKDCLFRRDDHCDNVDYWIKDDDFCSRGEDGRPWRK